VSKFTSKLAISFDLKLTVVDMLPQEAGYRLQLQEVESRVSNPVFAETEKLGC